MTSAPDAGFQLSCSGLHSRSSSDLGREWVRVFLILSWAIVC